MGAYFPIKQEKRSVFDFICSRGIELLGTHGVLIGDFNSGKAYLDEVGRTFSCIDCFERLETVGLIDSWRSRNPDGREFSWYSSGGNGFRLDHVFCTAALDAHISSIRYCHMPREQKTSDHSAMIVSFGL